jgi:hypothetical protein
MKIAPKNWQQFQHYKDRAPPWIKLHHKLLDDFEYQRLPVASRALAPMLWLLASEHQDGVIDADADVLAFRLRISITEVEEALAPLIGKGFFVVVQFDSKPLALCGRDAMPETEREAETEEKPEPPADAGPIWTESLVILTEQGQSAKTARSFLGMLCRQYEEGEIVEAVKASVGKADAVAYIRGVLKTRPKRGERERRRLAI